MHSPSLSKVPFTFTMQPPPIPVHFLDWHNDTRSSFYAKSVAWWTGGTVNLTSPQRSEVTGQVFVWPSGRLHFSLTCYMHIILPNSAGIAWFGYMKMIILSAYLNADITQVTTVEVCHWSLASASQLFFPPLISSLIFLEQAEDRKLHVITAKPLYLTQTEENHNKKLKI